MGQVAAAAALALPLVANADVDYDGIKYLGGGDQIDLNNANIRAYLRLSGMYPGAALTMRCWCGCVSDDGCAPMTLVSGGYPPCT